MKAKTSRISVIADDCTVSIDGVSLVVARIPDPDLHALHWDPASKAKTPGTVERKKGESGGFTDFEKHVMPYVKLWQTAKKRKDAQAKLARKEQLKVEKAEAKAKAEADAARAAAKQAADAQKPMADALNYLAQTDHEVIKYAEKYFAVNLPKDIRAKREQARKTVKAERAKLARK